MNTFDLTPDPDDDWDDPSADLRAEEPPGVDGIPETGDPAHLNPEVPF